MNLSIKRVVKNWKESSKIKFNKKILYKTLLVLEEDTLNKNQVKNYGKKILVNLI